MSETTGTVDDTATEEGTVKKSKNGKKVQWPADDANLATYHFFEMDEEERGEFLQFDLHEDTHLPLHNQYLTKNTMS